MGYTLLDTLSELWFTQFFNAVLLCTCLLVSRVSFLLFTCFCFQRKAEEFLFCFSILILVFWAVAMALLVLCHGT